MDLGCESRGHLSRFDDGHVDTERGHLVFDRLHQPFDGELAGRVHRFEGKGHHPDQGGHGDQPPPAIGAHVRQERLKNSGRPDYIDLQAIEGAFEGHLFKRTEKTDPHIGKHRANLPEAFQHLVTEM